MFKISIGDLQSPAVVFATLRALPITSPDIAFERLYPEYSITTVRLYGRWKCLFLFLFCLIILSCFLYVYLHLILALGFIDTLPSTLILKIRWFNAT